MRRPLRKILTVPIIADRDLREKSRTVPMLCQILQIYKFEGVKNRVYKKHIIKYESNILDRKIVYSKNMLIIL